MCSAKGRQTGVGLVVIVALVGLSSAFASASVVHASGESSHQGMTVYQCTFGDIVKHANLELNDPSVEFRKGTQHYTLFVSRGGTASYVSRITTSPQKVHILTNGVNSVFVENSFGSTIFMISVFETDRDQVGRTPAILSTHGWSQVQSGGRPIFSPETSVGYCLVGASKT